MPIDRSFWGRLDALSAIMAFEALGLHCDDGGLVFSASSTEEKVSPFQNRLEDLLTRSPNFQSPCLTNQSLRLLQLVCGQLTPAQHQFEVENDG